MVSEARVQDIRVDSFYYTSEGSVTRLDSGIEVAFEFQVEGKHRRIRVRHEFRACRSNMPGDGAAPEADSDSDGYISPSELHRRMLEKKKQFPNPVVAKKGAFFDVYGADAKAEVILHPPGPNSRLTSRDLQNLVRWVLADGENPKWVFVRNKPLVRKVVVVRVPEGFPSLTRWCGAPRVVSGGGNVEDLLSCQLKGRKRAREESEEERVGSRRRCGRNQPSSLRACENQLSLQNQPSLPAACKHQASSLPPACENQPSLPQPSSPLSSQNQPSLAACQNQPSQPSLSPACQNQPSLLSACEDQPSSLPACQNQPSSLPACQNQPSQPSLRACQNQPSLPPARENHPSLPASFHILTAHQLRQNGYPKHEDTQLPPGYVRTLPAADATPGMELVAIDCEMCYTHLGLELTRVSAVDSCGAVLLDTLVKPANPITNYNTQHSGITAAMMAPVTTTLAEVQAMILNMVRAETILVGHSLENDLAALKVAHARVIDTAVMYQRRHKVALRVLSFQHLQRAIQGGEDGHDSVEDARAAMDLALLKIRNGPGFPRLAEPSCEGLGEVLARHGRRSSLIDRREELQRYAVSSCNAIVAVSDEEVCSKAVEEVANCGVDFVWAQFKDADEALEDRFKRLYDAVEPNSLLIVTANHQGGEEFGAPLAFTCMK